MGTTMKAPSLRSVAQALVLASGLLAIPTPAHAALDGINRLIQVTQNKAANANEQALEGADKQRKLIEEQKKIRGAQAQLEGASLESAEDPQVSHAGLVVADIDAIVAFESKASSDGLDAAERKQLRELVSVAQQRVGDATKTTATALADAKKSRTTVRDAHDKASLDARIDALRATYKAHRKTSAALRTLAKALA